MEAIVQPQWTAPMYAPTTGRDHLGLGSVSSFQILASLSPGINVLTIHPRYYSFYCFLLYQFWQEQRPQSRTEWVRYFRPRALAYSLACHLSQATNQRPIGSIIGSNGVKPLLATGQTEFDLSYNYIKSDLGGYGLYYRNTMITVGLIVPGGPGLPLSLDAPTPEGKEIADAFRRAIVNTAYYRDYFADANLRVPLSVLSEYGEAADLERLPGGSEHALLLHAFLHGSEDVAGFAAQRRATFRFLLDVSDQTAATPIDEDAFRQLIYFRSTLHGARYQPRPEVRAVYRKWRMYQMREYYAFALNAMWDYLCTWGINHNGDIMPLRLGDFWAHLQYAVSFEQLAAYLGVAGAGLTLDSDITRLFAWLRNLVHAENGFDRACTLASPVHEHQLYRLALQLRGEPSVMVGGMLLMLSMVYLRIGSLDQLEPEELEIAVMGADGRLDLAAFVTSLRHRIDGGDLPIRAVLQWLFTSYIIDQHIRVATDKLPDNTFRFRREGVNLQFYPLPNSLTFMNSRFDALSTTIHELGLCGDWRYPDHGLTSLGRQLLDEGDLP